MRAVWITRHGPPEVLEVREGPDPEPGPGEVGIEVACAGINFADLSARVGLYPEAPAPPCVVGYEVAGVVDALGDGVGDLERGTRVAAMTRFGGYADRVCVPRDQVSVIPDSMSFAEGTALMVHYLTAHHMVHYTGRLHPGQRVLVHMAAGGVGQALIQLCRMVPDVEIFGSASAPKHDFLRELGVDHCIDYRSVDYADEVRRLTDGEGVDVIFDALGGKDWRKGYELLRPAGRLVAFGFANAVSGTKRNMLKAVWEFLRIPKYSPWNMMQDNRTVTGVNLGKLWNDFSILTPQADRLIELYEQGHIKPNVDKQFPFERAPEAHQYIHDRKNQGKVVLTTGHGTA